MDETAQLAREIASSEIGYREQRFPLRLRPLSRPLRMIGAAAYPIPSASLLQQRFDEGQRIGQLEGLVQQRTGARLKGGVPELI
jgi:hypothetical protein